MPSFWDLPPEILCNIISFCNNDIHSFCGKYVAPVPLYVFFDTLPARYRNMASVQYILKNTCSSVPHALHFEGTDDEILKTNLINSFRKDWWSAYYRFYACSFLLCEPQSSPVLSARNNQTVLSGFVKGVRDITGFTNDMRERCDAFLDMYPTADTRSNIVYKAMHQWFFDAGGDRISEKHSQRIVQAVQFCLKSYPHLKSRFKDEIIRKLAPFRDHEMSSDRTLLRHQLAPDTAHAFLKMIKEACELNTLSEFIRVTNMGACANIVSQSVYMSLLALFPYDSTDDNSQTDPFLVVARAMNEPTVVRLLRQCPQSCRLTRILNYAHNSLVWLAFRWCGFFRPFYALIPEDKTLNDSEIDDIICDNIVAPILRHDASYTDEALASLVEDLVRDNFVVIHCTHAHNGLRVIIRQIQNKDIRARAMLQLVALQADVAYMLYNDETTFWKWQLHKREENKLNVMVDTWAELYNTTREHVGENITGSVDYSRMSSKDANSLEKFLRENFQNEIYNTNPLLIYLRSLGHS